jgi:hypothetical protein
MAFIIIGRRRAILVARELFSEALKCLKGFAAEGVQLK